MKISIASDHAGFAYKLVLLQNLRESKYEVTDLGAYNEEPCDYPDYATYVADSILKGESERGILICGSAVGVSIVANKFPGIRAGVCHDTYSAHQSVEHDNVNILCLGQRIIGIELAREIVFTFLKSNYTNAERHQKRLQKLMTIEEKNMK